MSTQPPHVVILGGGFGGFSAARALRKARVRVTLIDQRAFSTFQPLLYQVASSSLNPGDVTYFLRAARAKQRNLRVETGKVKTIEADKKRVVLADNRAVTYDYLVVATGVEANFFGIPGAEEHALPLYTRDQAVAIRDQFTARLEMSARVRQSLRMVIVGAGPTGVETAGAFAELYDKDLPVLYPELDRADRSIALVDMAPRVLGGFSEESSDYTEEELEKRGVDIKLGQKVKEVREDGVLIEDSETGEEDFVEGALIIWASGVGVPDAVSEWGLPQVKGGRIPVDEHLRVEGHPNIYAAGDIARVGEGKGLPQLAQPAKQTGDYIGRDIAARIAGEDIDPFEYADYGVLATIGRADAVAEIAHMPRLTGFTAWMLWNSVHIGTLFGGRNRLASFVNLTSKYLLWSTNQNLIVGDIESRIRELIEQRKARKAKGKDPAKAGN